MKIKQVLGISAVSALTLSMPVFAATNLTNSIGSVDMEDANNNVGIDETQDEKTTYSDEITEDVEEEQCDVYATQASTFSVIIPKTLILTGDAGAENSGTYKVVAKGNIAGNETIEVKPTSDTFVMKQAGKDDITATITQTMTKFKVEEYDEFDKADYVLGVDKSESKTVQKEVDGEMKDVTETTLVGVPTDGKIVVSNLTAGSWKGTFNFSIALNTDTSDVCE